MSTKRTETNQGEGDRRSAKRYNRNATEHAKSGASGAAARDASEAIEQTPRAHQEAERAGKARAAELDPAVSMPKWWVDRTDTTWNRIKAAFRRDWEQTKSDLSLGHAGEELDQNLVDTLKQMSGSDPLPPTNEPTGVDLEVSKAEPERAFEVGYNAAAHYSGEWTPTVESRLRADWTENSPGAFWDNNRTYVYLGWRHQRRLGGSATPTE
jgi:hypothetical protein